MYVSHLPMNRQFGVIDRQYLELIDQFFPLLIVSRLAIDWFVWSVAYLGSLAIMFSAILISKQPGLYMYSIITDGILWSLLSGFSKFDLLMSLLFRIIVGFQNGQDGHQTEFVVHKNGSLIVLYCHLSRNCKNL